MCRELENSLLVWKRPHTFGVRNIVSKNSQDRYGCITPKLENSNKVSMNVTYEALHGPMFSFPLDKYLGVEWLDYVGRFILNILRICKQLSKVIGALTIPPISICKFQCIHIFANNLSGTFKFNFNLLLCVTLIHYGFNFHFPNDW